VSKDFDQAQTAPRKFKLGPLGNLNQVTKGLAKTIVMSGTRGRRGSDGGGMVENGQWTPCARARTD
jgi:hypothetical protein